MQTRRIFLAACAAPLLAQDKKELVLGWTNAQELTIEGMGWREGLKSPYDRLPAKAETLVRPEVWNLSRHSAGISVRFRTNAPSIHARWSVSNKTLSGSNVVAIAHSGLDLYVKDAAGKLRWLGFGAPDQFPEATRALVSGIAPEWREYTLYLPLFNGITKLEIGVPEGSKVEAAAKRTLAPVVFYGTSITHGASASRSGLTHVAMLERRLDRPVINLGFSGNGRMEIEVARLLTELDPAVYVIDCLPNIVEAQVTERTEPLVKELRRVRPNTPILLVEDRTYQDAFLVTDKRKRNDTSRAALRKVYASLKQQGLKDIYYLEGEGLLGSDGEGTIDSSHPTDLGFARQADAFEKPLRQMLKKVKR